MILKSASDIAVKICYLLQPYCSKINIAGSIRRKKNDVGDIEIICLPHRVPAGQASLFGGSENTVPVKEFANVVQGLGIVELGKPSGRYIKIILHEGIRLDLFMPQEHDYYRIYAIRTGSAQYSSLFIAYGWKRIGWVGTDQGLRRREDCLENGDDHWKIINPDPELPPIWQSEKEFFEWIQVKYLEPQFREMYSNTALQQKQNLK